MIDIVRHRGPALNGGVRIALLAGLAALAPLTASAQTASGDGTKSAHPLMDRFEKANATHDGHLTQAQAESGGMPMVAKQFGAIDTDHKGYVTLPQIRQFMQAHQAAHKGQTGTPPS